VRGEVGGINVLTLTLGDATYAQIRAAVDFGGT
jgi:hypothetical protein